MGMSRMGAFCTASTSTFADFDTQCLIIVACILEHKVDNNYLLTRGGFLFGIDPMCIPNEDGDSVIHVSMVMVEIDMIQAQLVNKLRNCRWWTSSIW